MILKEMIKKTEYNFVIIGQVASKSFLNNKNITLKNLLGKFFRFSNKGVDLFLKQKKEGAKIGAVGRIFTLCPQFGAVGRTFLLFVLPRGH